MTIVRLLSLISAALFSLPTAHAAENLPPLGADLKQTSVSGVRRAKAALSSGCKPHPANSLQPEAIGAVMEVTKWLKPSISVSRIGDSASVQAAT